ncbi:MAG: metallophosphoesterase [Clostridiales bacterium]|nr:metallophosphoesterase [Clostridiales bacterium]
MIYVTADLHGLEPENFQKLLKKANFSENDFLLILGDVIDRGEHGIELLQHIMGQANMELLIGNHEAMMLSCSFMLDEITEKSIAELDSGKMQLFTNWLENGGGVTLKKLGELNAKSPEAVRDIFDFLNEAAFYEAFSVNEKDFIFTHSGFENFSPDKKLSEYCAHELIWNRPQLTDRYFDDITVIFGHTPTMYYGEEYKGKILKTDTWIDIDVGVGMGQSPVLLRLDDMREFYLNG